jgi:hypothetical protein
VQKAFKRCATYHWKTFDKDYNFTSNLTSIRGPHKKLWAYKMVGIPISKIVKLVTWNPGKNTI